MPVQSCTTDGGAEGFKCGSEGKCYPYGNGQNTKSEAIQKAAAQCAAIGEEPSPDESDEYSDDIYQVLRQMGFQIPDEPGGGQDRVQFRNMVVAYEGTFRPSGSSKPQEVTAERLRSLANSYQPNYRLAKLKLHHFNRQPSRGQVTDLRTERRADGKLALVADGYFTDPLAADVVEAGMYPDRSIELTQFEDDTFEGEYLTAIAFLGDEQPAISGMRPNSDFLVFEESYETSRSDGVIRFESAEATMSDDPEVQDTPTDDAPEDDGNDFEGAKPDGEYVTAEEAERMAERAAQKATEEIRSDLSEERKARLRAERQSKVEAELDSLEADGKLTPGARSLARELALNLEASETTLKFEDGDGDEKQVEGAEALSSLLRKLPSQKPDEGELQDGPSGPDFDEVPPENADLEDKLAYLEAHYGDYWGEFESQFESAGISDAEKERFAERKLQEVREQQAEAA